MIICIGLNPAIDRVLETPRFTVGTHAKVELKSIQAAGKAANVARVLSSLGVKSVLRGFVGLDAKNLYERSFSGTLCTERLSVTDQPTRINTTIIDPVNELDTHLREPGFVVNKDEFSEFCRNLELEAKKGDTVAFCGSLPRGIEPLWVTELIDRLMESGIKVAADVNGPLLQKLRGRSIALLKPNREELSEYLGREIGSKEEICRLFSPENSPEGLPEALLVSDGNNGAGFFSQKEAFWCPPAQVEVKSTVGAGDALLSGFLAGTEKGLGSAESLKLASATAASAVESYNAGEIVPERVNQMAAALKTDRI